MCLRNFQLPISQDPDNLERWFLRQSCLVCQGFTVGLRFDAGFRHQAALVGDLRCFAIDQNFSKSVQQAVTFFPLDILGSSQMVIKDQCSSHNPEIKWFIEQQSNKTQFTRNALASCSVYQASPNWNQLQPSSSRAGSQNLRIFCAIYEKLQLVEHVLDNRQNRHALAHLQLAPPCGRKSNQTAVQLTATIFLKQSET